MQTFGRVVRESATDVGESADAGDGGGHNVAMFEKVALGDSDAFGCAGEDDVTRCECRNCRDVGDELRNAEDQAGGRVFLTALAVHVAGDLQVVAISQEVGRSKPRAGGSVRIT